MLNPVHFPRLKKTYYGRLLRNPQYRLANGLCFARTDLPRPLKDPGFPVLPVSDLQNVDVSLSKEILARLNYVPDASFFLENQLRFGKAEVPHVVLKMTLESGASINVDTFLDEHPFKDSQVDLLRGDHVRSFKLPERMYAGLDLKHYWRQKLEPLFQFLVAAETPDEKLSLIRNLPLRTTFESLAQLSPSQRNLKNFSLLLATPNFEFFAEALRLRTSEALEVLDQKIQALHQADSEIASLSLAPLEHQQAFDELFKYGCQSPESEAQQLDIFGVPPTQLDLGPPFYYTLPLARIDLRILDEPKQKKLTAVAFMVSELWPLLNSLIIRQNLIHQYLKAQGN